MKKTIRVVYDLYKLLDNGSTEKVTVWDEVAFGKNNVEYDEDYDYHKNVDMFIIQVMEEGVVYIGDGRFIPVHNIHGFYFNDSFSATNATVTKPSVDKVEKPVVQPSGQSQPSQPSQQGKQHGTRHFGKYNKKIRHKNRHNRPQNQTNQAGHGATSLPFNIEKDKALDAAPVQETKTEQSSQPERQEKT